MKLKKMLYISIRLKVTIAAALLIVLMALLYPPVSGGIQTNANEEVGDGYCSSLSDGHCLNDDTSYDEDTSGSDNVDDENHLQNLFEQAMKATQSQDWQESPSLYIVLSYEFKCSI